MQKFEWTQECQSAFEDMKENLHHLSTIVVPKLGETLILYLSVSDKAISATLVRKNKKSQQPMYFTSRALHDTKTRCSQMEKLVLALVHTAWHLQPYFQAHPMYVLTNHDLKAYYSPQQYPDD